MKSRSVRERAELRGLLNAAADTRLPDKQLERERLRTFRLFFRRSLADKKGFAIRTSRDAKRRNEARRAALQDEQVIPNRAMKRAMGERGYGFGLGRMDVPKSRGRA